MVMLLTVSFWGVILSYTLEGFTWQLNEEPNAQREKYVGTLSMSSVVIS